MTRITFKLGMIYIFLAFLNITFFTVMVFENQVDLIVENAKYKALDMTDKIIPPIDLLSDDINQNSTGKDEILKELTSILDTAVDNYLIYNERSEVFLSHRIDNTAVDKTMITNAVNAASNKNFSGKRYTTDATKEKITFYIPFYNNAIGDTTISFTMSLKSIDDKMNSLYKQVLAVIAILIIIHIIIGFAMNFIIVRPLMILKGKTDEFSKGNFNARVNVKGNDELSLVSATFNSMAESVESFIGKLRTQNDLINMELDVAAQVQNGIYPQLRDDELFSISVYNNPLEKVSGDFHDFIKLAGYRCGFFIADVSGHGVPAALITMKIKDLITVTSSNFNEPSILLKFFNTSFADLMDKFSSYFTAAYLILDQTKGILSYSSAGHPDTIIVRKNGTVENLKAEGFVIGVSKEMSDTFKTFTTPVGKGDLIVLYTDGITESRNKSGVFFGDSKFTSVLKSCAGLNSNLALEEITAALKDFTVETERKDDETLIIIEVK